MYETDFEIETKKDESPLTQADLASHHVIVAGLQSLTPHIPIISEESAPPPFAERSQWPRYCPWMPDSPSSREATASGASGQTELGVYLGMGPPQSHTPSPARRCAPVHGAGSRQLR